MVDWSRVKSLSTYVNGYLEHQKFGHFATGLYVYKYEN